MLHSATSSWGGLRIPPLVFTEHGAIMAATVLESARAAEMAVYVVRASAKPRQVLASNAELARKLEALEKSVATLDARTRRQFEEVYAAIRALMAPAPSKSRPIGPRLHGCRSLTLSTYPASDCKVLGGRAGLPAPVGYRPLSPGGRCAEGFQPPALVPESCRAGSATGPAHGTRSEALRRTRGAPVCRGRPAMICLLSAGPIPGIVSSSSCVAVFTLTIKSPKLDTCGTNRINGLSRQLPCCTHHIAPTS